MAIDPRDLTLRQRNIYYRRLVYSCCYGDLSYRYLKELEAGSECAKTTLNELMYLYQIITALNEAQLGDDCTDEDMLCALMEKAESLCSMCDSCKDGENIDLNDPSFPPSPCVLEADITVAGAVDVSFQPSALPGATYYIVSDLDSTSNGWSGHVGDLVTDDTFAPVIDGAIILNALNNTYWTHVPVGGPARLFPVLDGVLEADILTITSRYPMVHPYFGRRVVIEYSGDGVNWRPLYDATELPFQFPINFPMDGQEVLYVRVTYYDERGCAYGPYAAPLSNTPASHDIDNSYNSSFG